MTGRNKKTHHLFCHFNHAAVMVARNYRAYIKLSVTVVFSFIILFIYMAFYDATIYNRYAKVFSLPKEIVQCYIYDKPSSVRAFQKTIHDNIPNAEYYDYYSSTTSLTAYDARLSAECFFIPQNIETVYSTDGVASTDVNSAEAGAVVEPIKLVGEKQDFCLLAGEVIINESFYNSISLGDAQKPNSIPVTFYWDDGSLSVWDLEIVGICEDQFNNFVQYTEDGKVSGGVTLFLSQEQLNGLNNKHFESVKYICCVSSSYPEKVIQYGRSIGMVAQGAIEAQEKAKVDIQVSLQSKSITAIILFVLLAINLYSSLSNVLETRNFEIGVKRAIGASKWAITREFLYEAILVLGFDTFLSISIAIDGLIVYKFIQKYLRGIHWIVYISSISMYIYLFCCLGLIVAFGLIFAYKATQVEIVKYLKNE